MPKLCRINLLLIAALICGLFTACSDNVSTSTSVDVLTIYTPHPLDFFSPLVGEFEQRYGIKVNVVTAGTGELLAQIEEQKSKPTADIIWGGSLPIMLPHVDKFENYQSINEKYFADEFKNKEGCLTRFSIVPSVLMINKRLIGEIRVRGYADLLNTDLRGRIACANPAKSSSALSHLATMLYAMGEGKPDGGWNFVGKLCDNLNGKLLDSSADVYDGVANGKYAVGLTFEEAALDYMAKGYPVDIVYMKEGTLLMPDTIAIIKDAPHIANARKFIDYLSSKDIQALITAMYNRRSVRTDVVSKPELISLNLISKLEFRDTDIARSITIWQKHFMSSYEGSR